METLLMLADAAPGSASDLFNRYGMFVLLGLGVFVFYFLMVRPQRKKEAEHQVWLKNLKRGDEVVTHSGFWGKVSGTDEKSPYLTLELQDKVRVRVLRTSVAGKAPAADAGSSSAAVEEKKD